MSIFIDALADDIESLAGDRESRLWDVLSAIVARFEEASTIYSKGNEPRLEHACTIVADAIADARSFIETKRHPSLVEGVLVHPPIEVDLDNEEQGFFVNIDTEPALSVRQSFYNDGGSGRSVMIWKIAALPLDGRLGHPNLEATLVVENDH